MLEVLALILLIIVGYLVANLLVSIWAIALVIMRIISVIAMFRRKREWYFIGGSIAILIIGVVFVFRGEKALIGANPLLAVLGAVGLAAFIWIIGRNISSASRQEPYTDPDRLVGMIGTAKTDVWRDGSVYVNGENWSAVSDEPVTMGSQVQVIQRKGLVLEVKLIKEN